VASPSTSLAARLVALDRPEQRPERERLIREALGDAAPSVREVAVAWAARVLEPEALVPLVADGADALLRNAALAALERQGPYAISVVERAVASADADLAMFACLALGRMGGASSVAPLLDALGRGEINVIQAAAEALGRLGRREAVAPLVGLLQREPWLQLAAVDALGAIGDPAATEALLDLIPDSMMAEPALIALARIAPPTATARLLALLADPRHVRLRGPLLRAVGAILVVGRSADLGTFGRHLEADHGENSLWQFLAECLGGGVEEQGLPVPAEPGDDRNRPRKGNVTLHAAGALVLAGGVASLLPLLVRWAETPDGREWLEPLVSRHPGRLEPLANALLRHPDPAVRAGTLWILLPAAMEGDHLRAALADPAASVRVAACHAIVRRADPAAAEPLAALLDAGGPPERAAAAEALARLPDEARVPLLAGRLVVGTPEPVLEAVLSALAGCPCPALEERTLQLAAGGTGVVRRAALRAVARVPGARAEVLLLRALADRDPALQVEALDLLMGRGGDRLRATLLAMLGVEDSLRYHVIRALGRLGHAEAVVPLKALFASAPLHERIEILAALARLGGPAAREFLRQSLDQPLPEIRRAAAQGFAALAEAGDLELLRRLAGDQDWVLRSEAARALGGLGPGPARPLLLDLVRDLEPAVARTARAALAER
jgi:HEAT repeat protein